jgi:predicted amidohydrolase
MEESMEIPSFETDRLSEAARKTGSMVCIGVNERDRLHQGSIYNTLLFISHDGILLGRHRKLTPAYREKVFWTPGKPEDLRSVYATPFGNVGGLICAEHLNPLLKSAMIIQAEQVHIACYPGWSLLPREIMDLSIRQYALECQCYVLAASQYLKGRPEGSSDDEANWEFYGGSGVVDPEGSYLAGPSYGKEEILYAEVDLDRIAERKAWIDVAGKDARWDVIPFLQSLREA